MVPFKSFDIHLSGDSWISFVRNTVYLLACTDTRRHKHTSFTNGIKDLMELKECPISAAAPD